MKRTYMINLIEQSIYPHKIIRLATIINFLIERWKNYKKNLWNELTKKNNHLKNDKYDQLIICDFEIYNKQSKMRP